MTQTEDLSAEHGAGNPKTLLMSEKMAHPLEHLLGPRPQSHVLRIKAAGTDGIGSMGVHKNIHPNDKTDNQGWYAFVHQTELPSWGLGWRLHPLVVDGVQVYEIETAGQGGCGPGWYLTAVYKSGQTGRVGVLPRDKTQEHLRLWRVLPSPFNANQIMIQLFKDTYKGEPMYVSVARRVRRDGGSMYLELCRHSPILFDVKVTGE